MSVPGGQIFVLNANAKRETGREAQLGNISAAKTVADIIRTCLGPKAMLKMILDSMGGIVMTNDGNAILRELDVAHPAAKSMIELSRSQDENVGDGTTSVIILAGEMLEVAQPWIERNLHPTIIISSYFKALDDVVSLIDKFSITVDPNNREKLTEIITSCVGTKLIAKWGTVMTDLALDSVKTVETEVNGQKEVDIKHYIRIEKIPGGDIKDSVVLKGVCLNKDVTHASMPRRIENPRILLMDCPLEFTKAESQLDTEITDEDHWNRLLEIEEEYIQKMCDDILKFKPNIVVTEKGLSDLVQHFLRKANVTCLRRTKKTDNVRIAKACGATIVHRTDEITESDIGTGCGLFEVKKIGDEYFSFFVECKNPKACTVILRGSTKDVLNEIERNLHDAMAVTRNIILDPRLVPGGGAIEMAISRELMEKSNSISGVKQWPYQSVAVAFEVIPRTLIENCGANIIKTLTALRAKHAEDPQKNYTFGVDGETGKIVDMKTYGIWEPYVVKLQTIKTSIESACLLLRVDGIVSGLRGKGGDRGA